MLEPNEIDTYFNADASAAKAPVSKIVRHTRKVMFAKLTLPGIAAILAVTLLLIPMFKKDIREFGLDFAIGEGDIEKLNVDKTTIYVTDKNNRVNNFFAHNVKETSAGSKLYDLTSPEAIMPTSDKEWINIKSPKGLFNQKKSLLHLTQNIEAFYSQGMNIQTQEAFFDFKRSIAYSKTPVTGDGFLGKIDSQGFKFNADKNTLVFTGKTNMLIHEEAFTKE